MAAEKSTDVQLQTTFVTFDQPLYVKARDIVACCGGESELKNIIIRLENTPTDQEISEHPIVAQLAGKLEDHLLRLTNNGPTAKLWLQYFHMITILKLFIQSKREGYGKFEECDERRRISTIYRKWQIYFQANGEVLVWNL
ncbi:PREDICTED: uncharacterized protein LOC108759534, partial [Trachymyrmex cornetzi]|uniref:uncharacterized protein LOC108759534 n=1 Tax=Trachymyrmex cornetzi TaxID=471704 RepID=UPI00084F4DFC